VRNTLAVLLLGLLAGAVTFRRTADTPSVDSCAKKDRQSELIGGLEMVASGTCGALSHVRSRGGIPL